MRIAGIDAGTTAMNAAVFGAEGRLLRSSRHPMPPLELEGGRAWQPLEAVLAAADAALADIAGAGADLIALTTQRDTLVLLDAEGAPLTELVSWRDARAGGGTLWDALAGTEPALLRDGRAVRSLASLLTERWAGRAVDSEGTLPRHLKGEAGARLGELAPGIRRPERIETGEQVGTAGGTPLHLAAGDKNCELLGSGVLGAGRAGLSLGSAISLGQLADGRPDPGIGYVVTAAALPGRWNVETGLLAGMSAADRLTRLLGAELELAPGFLDVPVFLPHLAGALDRPGRRGAVRGWTEATTSAELVQGWAQGVVCELRRLRPALEAAAGSAITEIVLGGGGAAGGSWADLVAAGLEVPVRAADALAGARGAAASALGRTGSRSLDRFLAGAAGEVVAEPAPAAVAAATRFHREYMTFFESLDTTA